MRVAPQERANANRRSDVGAAVREAGEALEERRARRPNTVLGNLGMKVRLAAAVAEREGITRSQARSLIMEGRVSVEDVVVTKAGQSIRADARIELERPRKFV